MANFVNDDNLKSVLTAVKNKFGDVEEKVVTELNKKANVVVCDNQYEFDQIKTKDNNTIYLIKGDQDVWAAKDYVDELFDLIVDLRNRVTVLESRTLGIDDEGEEGSSMQSDDMQDMQDLEDTPEETQELKDIEE